MSMHVANFKATELGNGSKIKNSRPVACGLKNLGNTCYLNSVIQVLTHSRALTQAIQRHPHQRHCPRKSKTFCILCELEKHVTAAWSEPLARAPWSLVSHLRHISPDFTLGRQHDAHEFLRLLVDKMQESCLAPGTKPPKMEEISKLETPHLYPFYLFQGSVQSVVQCLTCSNKSTRTEVFEDLQLEIQDTHSVESALEKYTAKEFLEGSNAYACDHCKSKTRAAKRLLLHRTPPILALQLKRFAFGLGYGGMGGVSSMWCNNNTAGYGPSLGLGGAKVKHWVKFQLRLDLHAFTSSGSEPDVQDRGSLDYSLYAVLVHFGSSLSAGHYYCYVRCRDKHWYRLDDSSVERVDQQTVMKEKAYMLFYRCNSSKDNKVMKRKEDQQRCDSDQPVGLNGNHTSIPPYNCCPSPKNQARGDLSYLHRSSHQTNGYHSNSGEQPRCFSGSMKQYPHSAPERKMHKKPLHHKGESQSQFNTNPNSYDRNHVRYLNKQERSKEDLSIKNTNGGSYHEHLSGCQNQEKNKQSGLSSHKSNQHHSPARNMRQQEEGKAKESHQLQAKSLKRPLSHSNNYQGLPEGSQSKSTIKHELDRSGTGTISFSIKPGESIRNPLRFQNGSSDPNEARPPKKRRKNTPTKRASTIYQSPQLWSSQDLIQRIKGIPKSIHSFAKDLVEKSTFLKKVKTSAQASIRSNPGISKQEIMSHLNDTFINNSLEDLMEMENEKRLKQLENALLMHVLEQNGNG